MKMIGVLGEEYVTRLRKLYQGRVPGGADLVTYWFEKARAQIAAGRTQRAGLVATNSIRQKRNRPILERIRETGAIFHAWADEPWVNDGAAVRVSLVGFGATAGQPILLDGRPVTAIHADLTGARTGSDAVDLTQARPLTENTGYSFFGLCLAGAFAVDSETARGWLRQPNPHGRPNSDVLRPICNGVDSASPTGFQIFLIPTLGERNRGGSMKSMTTGKFPYGLADFHTLRTKG